jgi:hypothetical protein
MSDTFREIALKMAAKQAALINDFAENALFWAGVPMQPTSDGFKNQFEKVVSIDALKKLTGLDGALTEVAVETSLGSTDLSVFGGKMTCPQDKASALGGKEAYFENRLKQILPYTAQNFETGLYYNELRPYAKRLGQEVSAGGTTANKQYSMICIQFFPGETTGLYNPKGFGDGKVFETFWYNGGNLYDVDVNVPGYGMFVKSNFGIQLEGDKHCASIVNIDLADDGSGGHLAMPTEIQIDDMLDSVRAMPQNTVILAHPRVIRATAVLKRAVLQMGPNDDSYPGALSDWDGIPFVGSYNILKGTEAVVA